MDAASHVPDDAPVCPRHPERVSRLTCRDCGRPTCPVCQVPDATGFVCVDCSARQGRTGEAPAAVVNPPWGGSTTWSDVDPTTRADVEATGAHEVAPPAPGRGSGPIGPVVTPAREVERHRPVATWTLIGICVVVYLFQWLTPQVTQLGDFYPMATYVQPWRFLTAAFLHAPGNPAHILFNLMGLYAMGQFLEPALGRARYIALYLLSALGGSVGYLLLLPTLDLIDRATQSAWAGSMVGASGAVFGLFTAALVVLRRAGSQIRSMIVLIAINLAMPFFYPGIAWQAHLGGAVVGFVVTLFMVFAARRGPAARWAAVLVPSAALVVAAWLKFRASAPALEILAPYIQLQG